jgi:hypothetical protein
MTITPKGPQDQSSSPDRTMTDFKDGLGRPIPAAAFENDSGPPADPKMSPEGLKQFDNETATIKAAAEKMRG